MDYFLFCCTLYFFSRIDSEAFSPLPVIFSCKSFHINLIFFSFIFEFHYCVIHRNLNYLIESSGYGITGVLHSPLTINKGSQARVPYDQERLTIKEVMTGF